MITGLRVEAGQDQDHSQHLPPLQHALGRAPSIYVGLVRRSGGGDFERLYIMGILGENPKHLLTIADRGMRELAVNLSDERARLYRRTTVDPGIVDVRAEAARSRCVGGRCGEFRLGRLLKEAGYLCDAGLGVVPLRYRSKHPIFHDWPRYATRDRRVALPTIERLGPEINLGAATGRGILALDVDPRNGGRDSLRRLLGPRFCPRTAHAMTGGCGDHFLFRVPDGVVVRNRAIDGYLGLDIKGDGGLIVVEPSVHPKFPFREYIWRTRPRDGLAPVPSPLRRALKERRILEERGHSRPDAAGPILAADARVGRSGEAQALAAELIARFPVAGFGRRNEVQLRAVVSLVGRGYDDTIVRQAAGLWLAHYHGLGVVHTPLVRAHAQLEATIRCVAKRANRSRLPQAQAYSMEKHAEMRGRVTLSERERGRLASCIIRPLRGRRTQAAEQGDSRGTPASSGKPPIREGLTFGGGAVALPADLIVTKQERQYLEILLLHHRHETLAHPGRSTLTMTERNVTDLAAERYGVTWRPKQVESLEAKYIDRPGKDASVCPLLREVRKGVGRPGRIGVPSEYEVVGLGLLVDPPAVEAGVESVET